MEIACLSSSEPGQVWPLPSETYVNLFQVNSCMNCRSVFITSERSEGSAVCGELQIFRSVQHREVWQIERPTKSCHVRRWLFTATAIIIVMVSLPLAAQSLNKTAPVT